MVSAGHPVMLISIFARGGGQFAAASGRGTCDVGRGPQVQIWAYGRRDVHLNQRAARPAVDQALMDEEVRNIGDVGIAPAFAQGLVISENKGLILANRAAE